MSRHNERKSVEAQGIIFSLYYFEVHKAVLLKLHESPAHLAKVVIQEVGPEALY